MAAVAQRLSVTAAIADEKAGMRRLERSVRAAIAITLVASAGKGGAMAAAPASAASVPNPYGPTYKYCGSFKSGYLIRVYATHLTCAKALRIQKEFWRGPRSRKTIVNGGSGAAGYVLLKRYPGWRCGSGSGGGQCNKGRASAAYQN